MTHSELSADEMACINCQVPRECNPLHELCGNAVARKKATRESFAGRKLMRLTRGVKSAGVKKAMREAFWREILADPPTKRMQVRAMVALREMGVEA